EDSCWRVEYINAPDHLDPRTKAKFPKINPQRYECLKEYEYVVWMDGTMGIKEERYPFEILEHIKNGVVFSPHFENRDAYSEATIVSHPKYQKEPLAEQAEFYRSEGFPEGTQLYECT